MLLSVLPVVALVASTACAQATADTRTTIQVRNDDIAGMPLPDWYLQDLVTSRPDATTSRIAFNLFRTNTLDTAIANGSKQAPRTACSITWTGTLNEAPPQGLKLCEDGQTYWRFPSGRTFAEGDFWIEVVRPGYIAPTGPVGTKEFTHWIKIEYGAIHLSKPALQCVDVAAAITGPIEICTLGSQKFATTNDAMSLAKSFHYYDQGLRVNVTDFTAVETAQVPQGAENGASFSINEKIGTTQCAFHEGNAALPTIRNPQSCANNEFTWWTTQSRLGWAAGSEIRIQKRWTVQIDRGYAGLGMWDVDFELQFSFPLQDRPTFDYSCENNVCHGVSVQPTAAGHVFWADPGHIVLTL